MLNKLKALASNDRLNIVIVLTGHCHGEANVTDIAAAINLSQPATSQHLKKLHNADIVQREYRGNAVFYSIHPRFNLLRVQDALT